MTKENLTSLLRLIIMMANRPEVFVKVANKKAFAEAVMLVSPLINSMSRDELNKIRKELK